MDRAAELLAVLSRSANVLITTHVKPDGDAIGSATALHLALKNKSIASHILLLSPLPLKFEFLFKDPQIPHTILSASSNINLNSYDTLLVVDTGTLNQLPGVADRIATFAGPKLVIDHHLTQENWANFKWVDTNAAAAGEIVAELLSAWSVPLTLPLATALFLAIVSDTGWFQYSNTRPQTLRLAATLMETGLNTDNMYQNLYQNERAVRLLLQTRAQQSLELLANNRLAIVQVRKSDFLETHADQSDTEGFVNIPLQVRTVEVSAIFVQPTDDGPIRVSLRSKGHLDVARFAEKFGGGGHARAAGLKMTCSLPQARAQIVDALLSAL